MAVDSLDKCGPCFGTTGGQVYALMQATLGTRIMARSYCSSIEARHYHDPKSQPVSRALGQRSTMKCSLNIQGTVITRRTVINALEARFGRLATRTDMPRPR